MAYSDYPDYRSAFEKVSSLGAKLYGYADRKDLGLAAAMDRIASTKGEKSKEYRQAKARFDELQKEHQAAEAKLAEIKGKIDLEISSKKTEKTNKKQNERDNADIRQLTYQRDSLRRQNKTKEADAVQAKIDAIKNPEEKKVTGKSVKLTDAQQVDNYLASAGTSIGSSGPMVQVTEPNKIDPKGNPTVYEAFLYVEPGAPVSVRKGPNVVQQPGEKGLEFGTSDVIRDKYIKQLVKQYGSKQGVIDRLKAVGLLSTNKNVPSGAIDQALNNIIAEYTYEQVSAYKNYGVRDFPTLDEYMSNRPKGTGTSSTTSRVTTFSDTDFRALAQEVGKALFQRDLSPEELKKLQPVLEKAQRKTPEVTTTTQGASGQSTSVSTRTGLNSQQFLIEELAKTDEAKATKMLGFYDTYKSMMGVL